MEVHRVEMTVKLMQLVRAIYLQSPLSQRLRVLDLIIKHTCLIALRESKQIHLRNSVFIFLLPQDKVLHIVNEHQIVIERKNKWINKSDIILYR